MNDKAKPRRIQILRDTVALRIAAGEVIDRPFSVVRELIDNAVDCGAGNIDLYVEGGGIERIRVVDNGSGMSLEDLKKCYLPHATSKISEMEDLESLKTLGFRGEALSSIGACSRLEIISSETGADAGRLVVSNGALRDLSPYKGNKGTIVDVSGLFHAMPARKKFLKRPSAEAAACKKVFIDKVLPFCEISFRYFQDGAMKLFFPVSSLKERVINAYPGILNKDLTREMESSTEDFSVRIIAADPSVNRKDRRYIQLFVNNRRINDFSLLQAVEYGFSEFLPGGTYPVAFVFIKIKPSLIDVNIHPAKKEVKI
ncbi:MAG: DNA mismatch repair endonuclease MutL, partial [Spirochaetes bacterium]